MTYCVGMMLDGGLVFMSDTRTNAGVDNISVFGKTRVWHEPGDRTLVLLSAGNLATTQAVTGRLEERPIAPEGRSQSLMHLPSMFATAEMIGATLRDEIQRFDSAAGPAAQGQFSASLILGGQIAGGPPRLFLIYPEGNFIEATVDTPFFQIGETKYGRPIIVRAYRSDMTFDQAIKLLTVSFDSTIKANLSVGLPLDVTLVERDTLAVTGARMTEGDPYYAMISSRWGEALSETLHALPDPAIARTHGVPAASAGEMGSPPVSDAPATLAAAPRGAPGRSDGV